ncbi:protein of unknown function [Nitrospira defluvii]|uniref:Uncharacterized protein n=1 Tax=Nitrospira defluvii TaxID=330214 RepID=D8PHM1_9BACT|nr:protein of unknown function [Nitrospira defluvii]
MMSAVVHSRVPGGLYLHCASIESQTARPNRAWLTTGFPVS